MKRNTLTSPYGRAADAGRPTSKKEFLGCFSRVLASLEGVKNLHWCSKSRETINKVKAIPLHSDIAGAKKTNVSICRPKMT